MKSLFLMSFLAFSGCVQWASSVETSTYPAAPECQYSAEIPQDIVQKQSNAGCVVSDGERVLYFYSAFDNYDLPGGTAKEGELSPCTAARETWEETGIEVKVTGLLKSYPYSFFMFECQPVSSIQTDDQGRVNSPEFVKKEVDQVFYHPMKQLPLSQWRFENQREELIHLLKMIQSEP
tara:strand:- start:700 stop:1233 length:534 start_codon:yes stop_codon:yes gene_type:complete